MSGEPSPALLPLLSPVCSPLPSWQLLSTAFQIIPPRGLCVDTANMQARVLLSNLGRRSSLYLKLISFFAVGNQGQEGA